MKNSTIYPKNALPEGVVPALRVEPMPKDTNQNGDVFGGWVMSHVDLAGASTAMRYAQSRYIVTRAVSGLTFEAPVMVGDIVSFYADIVKVGRTSLTVKVTVYAERLTKMCNSIAKITEAELIFVALDSEKKPIPLDEARAQFSEVCSIR
ncbi:MAG: acyl-CoA thioesterase [Opitutales bacterium]|nr:acyl-CoA thioesterase [Opitutales bacterium]